MTTLTAFLDLSICPVSFDAVVFLVKAEMERKRIGATRMHVVLVGEVRKKSQYDDAEAHWRLWNICIPACQFFGATVTLATDWTQARRLVDEQGNGIWPPDWNRQTLKDRRHLIGDVITASRAGEDVPKVNASEHARRSVRAFYATLKLPVVTMTMRNTYLPQRNSNRAALDEAKRHIEANGFSVVTMEDTSVAIYQGSGYGELNLDVRAACYQESVLNIQSNNGAASLCWFSERPYRMFGAGVPADEWNGLFVKQGLPLGETWPWASPGQKIVYGPTSADQIIEEFEAWDSATSCS